MLRALAIVASMMCGRAQADVHWYTHAEMRNDVFTELRGPVDDDGFTHDNVFSLLRERDGLALGGGFTHRWITSRADRRRWDQLDVLALATRRWPHAIVTSARFGPTLGGNYGGRAMQNVWHDISGTGRTLDQGLQNMYAGDRRYGALVGAAVRATWPPTGPAQAYAFADGQLGLGAGLHRGELALGARAFYRHVGVHAEVAVTAYRVVDPSLALPGGYGDGAQREWRAGVDVRWSRFALGYEYRANEGGSREPIAVLAFESRR